MRNTSSLISVLAVMLLTGSLTSSCLGEEAKQNDIDPQKLRAQVTAGWKQALEIAKRLQVSYAMKEVDLDRGGEAIMHATGKERATGNIHLEAFELLAPTVQHAGMSRIGYSYVRGVNTKYMFSLAKAVGKQDWVLKDVKLSPSAPEVDQMSQLEDFQALRHFKLEGQTVAEFLSNKGIKLVSVATAEGNLVRVAYKRWGSKDGAPLEGVAFLDPEALWCVREFASIWQPGEFRFANKGTNRYTRGREGFPLLSQQFFDTTAMKGKEQIFHSQMTTDFRTSLRDDIPEYEFSLSAFGLSEPAGIDMPRPRGYLWFYLVGAFCLLVSMAIGWRVRRSRSPGTAALREARP